MNSYQKLKSKCDYLENQVKLFKDALTINLNLNYKDGWQKI